MRLPALVALWLVDSENAGEFCDRCLLSSSIRPREEHLQSVVRHVHMWYGVEYERENHDVVIHFVQPRVYSLPQFWKNTLDK